MSQDIFGVKVRVAGDAIYGQDTWLPQIAVGAEFKRHGGIDNGGVRSRAPRSSAPAKTTASTIYVSGTKVFLVAEPARERHAPSQQGEPVRPARLRRRRGQRREAGFETTVGYLLTRKLAIGGEYRSKPDNLGVDDEGAAWDLFVAYAPNRHVSIVAAYLEPRQHPRAGHHGEP